MNGSRGDAPDSRAQAFPALAGLPKGTQVFAVEERGVTLLYNITKAQEVAHGRAPALTIEVASVAKLAYARDTDPEPEEGFAVDPDWAMTRDLRQPLLVVFRAPELGGAPEGQVIDGWHRIYKAARQGVVLLRAVIIAAEEEPAIRLAPDDETLRRSAQAR